MNEDLFSGGATAPSGSLLALPVRGPLLTFERKHINDLLEPKRGNTEFARDWRSDNAKRVKHQARRLRWAERRALSQLFGALYIVAFQGGVAHDLGLASLRVVTNNGVGFIVDAFQNLVELENMKFHGIGTGTNAEAAGDSALQTEVTTGLNPDNTRATGTTTESASNIYQTVATNTVDATVALTEHGVFSQAATGGGVLLDRSVYSAVNLVSGDSLQTDYRLTVVSGS